MPAGSRFKKARTTAECFCSLLIGSEQKKSSKIPIWQIQFRNWLRKNQRRKTG